MYKQERPFSPFGVMKYNDIVPMILIIARLKGLNCNKAKDFKLISNHIKYMQN
jgi:hypothetical protein